MPNFTVVLGQEVKKKEKTKQGLSVIQTLHFDIVSSLPTYLHSLIHSPITVAIQ